MWFICISPKSCISWGIKTNNRQYICLKDSNNLQVKITADMYSANAQTVLYADLKMETLTYMYKMYFNDK